MLFKFLQDMKTLSWPEKMLRIKFLDLQHRHIYRIYLKLHVPLCKEEKSLMLSPKVKPCLPELSMCQALIQKIMVMFLSWCDDFNHEHSQWPKVAWQFWWNFEGKRIVGKISGGAMLIRTSQTFLFEIFCILMLILN